MKKLEFTPSLRKSLPLFFTLTFFSLVLLTTLFFFPARGFTLVEIARPGEDFNLVLSKTLYALFVISMIMFFALVMLIRILYIKTFKIILTPKTMEFQHGVLHRVVESVDLHVIHDFVKLRSFWDRILGLANIIIHAEDVRTPLVTFEGLTIEDAANVIDYLQANASNSLVEYFVNKEQIPKDYEKIVQAEVEDQYRSP